MLDFARAMLTAREVARILGISARSVRRLIAAGDLPVVHIGRAVRIRPQDLAAFIGRCAGDVTHSADS